MIVLARDGETIENNFGRSVGDVITVAVGNEQELRRAEQPDASKTKFHAAEPLNVVGKNRPLVGTAVPVGVFENQDPITQPQIEDLAAVGISVILGDPEAPTRIPGHRDRVSHLRLGGEYIDVKSLGNPETRRGRRRGQGTRRDSARIGRVREIAGNRGPVQHGANHEANGEEEPSVHGRCRPL